MTAPILATKLYLPPPPPNAIGRSDLLQRLNEGLHRNLTLISAPAGFGKTTLVSSWLAQCDRPAAWLSLEPEDSDPVRFMAYFIAALQKIQPAMGQGLLAILQSPQPPEVNSILPALINELASIPEPFILVLDDFHTLESRSIGQTLTFLLDHAPHQMHLVITSREDPPFNLARYRARGQMTELRVTDLRFTAAESSEFLNEAMGLELPAESIEALERRTEGWIAGLQLAALSMRGQPDKSEFIRSFTGSHRYILDYLVEEVLQQQSAETQRFLLHTSILDRFCASLCHAVLHDEESTSKLSDTAYTLSALEQANLFIIPLDHDRRWYRYHHLFADLLQQRLQQSEKGEQKRKDLHQRASLWFEESQLDIEAFEHAAKAGDLGRAERLIEKGETPLYFRGGVNPILTWLSGLDESTLNARPALWVIYGWALWISHQNPAVPEKIEAAEAAIVATEPDKELIGQIAALKAMLAANMMQAEEILGEAKTALAHLPAEKLAIRTAVTRALGLAYQIQGDLEAAENAYLETIAMCEATGNVFINILTSTGLGIIQRNELQLLEAAETYSRVLDMVGQPLQPVACEACYGLAWIHYEWNDLERAEQYVLQSIELGQQIEGLGILSTYQTLLGRIKRVQGEIETANVVLEEAAKRVQTDEFAYLLPDVVTEQILLHLQTGNIAAGLSLAKQTDNRFGLTKVFLAQENAEAAFEVLMPLKNAAAEQNSTDQYLKISLVEAQLHLLQKDNNKAIQTIQEALILGQAGEPLRVFVDEGEGILTLLNQARTEGFDTPYIRKVIQAFTSHNPETVHATKMPDQEILIDPLSEREVEVLRLLADGLSNREIGERLFIALSTVKGHNRIIFDKLQVKRRTEAVARARDLGLLE